MRDPFARLNPLAVTLFVAILVLDLVAGIYHLTHMGEVSGITELVMAVLFIRIIYPVLPARHGEALPEKSARSVKVALWIIAAAAAILLFLSIYHLTHEGLPSAIIEFSMTVMLGGLGYLIKKGGSTLH
ncbi:MAG: hypothetical protein HYX79_03275 [Chloroflexi bacterium]|nr:hypothetical protein [Chloroflexota bacterium]